MLKKIEVHHVVFKCREGNIAADRLARKAISLENNVSFLFLFFVMPDWIKSHVEVDKLCV